MQDSNKTIESLIKSLIKSLIDAIEGIEHNEHKKQDKAVTIIQEQIGNLEPD